jgi:hypothetical protein
MYNHLPFFIKQLLYLDALGPKPEIKVNHLPRYSTFLGVFSTLLSIIISFISIQFPLLNYINKDNALISSSPKFGDEPITLNSTHLSVYMNFGNFDNERRTFNLIPMTSLHPPFLVLVRQNATGYYFLSPTYNMTVCGDSTFKDFNSGFFQNNKSKEEIEHIMINSYCIPDGLNFEVNYGENTQDYLQIGLPFDPYSQLIQDQSYLSANIFYRTLSLLPDNFNDYYRMQWKQGQIPLDKESILFYDMKIQKTHLIKDQTNFIFTDKIRNIFLNSLGPIFSQRIKRVSIADFDVILGLSFSKSDYNVSTLIKYYSLNDVMAFFGGTYQVIAQVAAVFMSFIVPLIYSPLLVNSIFNKHQNHYSHQVKDYKRLIQDRNFRVSENKNQEISVPKFNAKEVKLILNRIDIQTPNRSFEAHNPTSLKLEQLPLKDANYNIKIINSEVCNRKSTRDNLLDHESETLVEEIFNKISKKKLVKIKFCSYFSNKLKEVVFCSNPKNHEFNLVKKGKEIIDSKLEIRNLIKVYLEIAVIKDLLYSKNEKIFSIFPSINLNDSFSTKSLKCLNESNESKKNNFNNDNGDKEILRMFLKSDLSIRKNKRMLSNYLNSNL